jgi:hypothetical protein
MVCSLKTVARFGHRPSDKKEKAQQQAINDVQHGLKWVQARKLKTCTQYVQLLSG